MYRFSIRTLYIANNVIKQTSHLPVANSSQRVLFNLPKIIFHDYRNLAEDVKNKPSPSTSPLSNLIAKDSSSEEASSDEEDKQKKREAAWRTMKRTWLFFGVTCTCVGCYLILSLGPPNKDEDGNEIEDELSGMFTVKQYLLRTYRELKNWGRLIQEPSREKLLPDPVQYPYLQPKYTLVLELNDVLVHPDWTYSTGWRFKKRPGIDYFLESLHGHFEIVIYTATQAPTALPILEAIDPKNIINHRLVRDATHFTNGHHVKSLNNLNRDLSKIIVVDWDANNVQFNPQNLLKIKRWNGNNDDLSLVDLSTFLKTIVENDVEDVREVLSYYSKYDDPIEAFREKHKKLMELLEAQRATKDQDSKPKPWVPSIFSRRPF